MCEEYQWKNKVLKKACIGLISYMSKLDIEFNLENAVFLCKKRAFYIMSNYKEVNYYSKEKFNDLYKKLNQFEQFELEVKANQIFLNCKAKELFDFDDDYVTFLDAVFTNCINK